MNHTSELCVICDDSASINKLPRVIGSVAQTSKMIKISNKRSESQSLEKSKLQQKIEI